MSLLPIQYRLEKSLCEELTGRVPKLTWHASQDCPEGNPPYGVVQCDEARETTPESGVFYVSVAILVTHGLDEGSGLEHAKVVQEVRDALEMLPRPGVDETHELRLYGFVMQRSTAANTEQEQGTLFEMSVGCGVLEKQEGGPVNTPDAVLT
jgi:hypothetical protein